jgi:hypothetical protein
MDVALDSAVPGGSERRLLCVAFSDDGRAVAASGMPRRGLPNALPLSAWIEIGAVSCQAHACLGSGELGALRAPTHISSFPGRPSVGMAEMYPAMGNMEAYVCLCCAAGPRNIYVLRL